MGTSGENGWGLEVVRGRDVGHVYALELGPSVLGNRLNGDSGIDLGPQEGTSPRRMAAKQAVLEASTKGLALRDLDSPGGTFVNRQRILPGQMRLLDSGDVIQLGAVQLKVVDRKVSVKSSTPTPAAPPTGPSAQGRAPSVKPSAPMPVTSPTGPPVKVGTLPASFTLANGTICRTWDDFLTRSAENWTALREELTTGRLSVFLQGVGRGELEPTQRPGETPDERLDAWLGRLPTTRPAQPDIEVHPASVRVRAMSGGGLTRSKVVITNTGYRLLRSTVRFEPASTSWVRVASGNDSRAYTTAESTEIPLDIEIPETLNGPLSCFLVVESNGGSRRIEVRAEPPSKAESVPEMAGNDTVTGMGLREIIAGLSPTMRVVTAGVVAASIRGLLALGERFAIQPTLAGPALLLAVMGGVIAALAAGRRGEARDVPSAAFAGAFVGVSCASVGMAVRRVVDPIFGRLVGESVPVAVLLWGASGVLLALLSVVLIPHESRQGKRP